MFSCQARLRSVALTIAIVAPVMAAHAQTSPAVIGHDTADRSFHLRVGGGTDVADGQNTNSTNALVGVDWEPRGTRFSLRTAVNYSRRAFNNERRESAELCINYCMKSATQLVGVSLDGRFDLMSSRLRPYLVSGVSLNRATLDGEWNLRCDNNGCVQTPGEFTVFRRTSMAGALHSGLGLSFQVGRSELFTEFRYQMVSNGFGTNNPMTLGIRF